MMIAVLEKLGNGETLQFPFDLLFLDHDRFVFMANGTIPKFFACSKYCIVSIVPA